MKHDVYNSIHISLSGALGAFNIEWAFGESKLTPEAFSQAKSKLERINLKFIDVSKQIIWTTFTVFAFYGCGDVSQL